jgi:hypothetical protein
MDAFFATKKADKLSQGHNCCQLFVTDKGFVCVVPMKSKAEALQAVQQFANEIGPPDAMTCNKAGKQTSRALKRFCLEISTTLRVLKEGTLLANKVLKEGTLLANKAKLCVGSIKEAARKDMLH